MGTKLPTRTPFDDRIAVQLPTSEKRRLFEIAASRNVTTSEFVRRAITSFIANDNAGSPRSAA